MGFGILHNAVSIPINWPIWPQPNEGNKMKTLAEIFSWLDLTALKGKNWSMEKYPVGYSLIRNAIKDETLTEDLYQGLICFAIAELSKEFEAFGEEKSLEKLGYIRGGFLGKRHKDFVENELAAAIAAAKAERERQEKEAIALAERKKAERAEKLAQLDAFVVAGANRETAGAIIFGSEWPDVRASLPEPAPETAPAPAKPAPAKPAPRKR